MSLAGRIDRSSSRSSGIPNDAARSGRTTSPWATAHSSTAVVGRSTSSEPRSGSMAVSPSPTSYRSFSLIRTVGWVRSWRWKLTPELAVRTDRK